MEAIIENFDIRALNTESQKLMAPLYTEEAQKQIMEDLKDFRIQGPKNKTIKKEVIMEFNTVKLEDLYRDWDIAATLSNSCKQTHDSAEAVDFSLYVSGVMAN